MKSLAISLLDYGFVSYNRTRKIICGLTNGEIDPSEGYLTKLQKNASNKLDDFVFDVKEELLKSKLNYWDDTTIKIDEKDRACMRVYTNSQVVLYKAHMKKDAKGMDEDGILQNLPNDCIVMHDHLLHNYCDEYKYQNIECNAHITRWITDFTLPYSNNLCETLLRMLKTKMKVSYMFQNIKHAKYFANINSYVETCSKFGINKHNALNKLFQDNPYTLNELKEMQKNKDNQN